MGPTSSKAETILYPMQAFPLPPVPRVRTSKRFPMKIDRIAIAILDWIRSVFYRSDRRSQSFQPNVLKRKTSIDGVKIPGQLALVERPNRRAIRTWVYMPPRSGLSHGQQKDVHICLDTLEKMSNEKKDPDGPQLKVERSKGRTHRVTIFMSSHWCGPNGEFDAQEIFSGYFKFKESGSDRHRWAIAALDDLAGLVPFRWSTSNIRWDTEMGLSRIKIWQESKIKE